MGDFSKSLKAACTVEREWLDGRIDVAETPISTAWVTSEGTIIDHIIPMDSRPSQMKIDSGRREQRRREVRGSWSRNDPFRSSEAVKPSQNRQV
jgi:hypothetical protein